MSSKKVPGFTVPVLLSGVVLLLLLVAVNRTPARAQGAGPTSIVSVASGGAHGDGGSEAPSLSADGRYVAFESTATNLVANDTNGIQDIFVHDRQEGTTERVSVAADGAQGNGESAAPSLSANGWFVAFESFASNLVANDTNGTRDVFVRDRQAGTTERVSVAGDGTQADLGGAAPRISADGRYVAFESIAANLVAGDTNGTRDIFVRDRQTGTTQRVSVGSGGTQSNGDSFDASISADGRWVTFYSYATNLVWGDWNGATDVFLHDRQSGTTRRVSVAGDGTQGNARSDSPHLSADGRWLAFASEADNLVPGDTNRAIDVFVSNLETGTLERVSVAGDGTQGNARSTRPALSADGRWVAFSSDASNLVGDDTQGCFFAPNGQTYNCSDVFIHDRQTGKTQRVSVASDGTQGNSNSGHPDLARPASLSDDGRWIAFYSFASNLVADDTNGLQDVFLYDREAGSATPTPTPGQNCPSGDLNDDGRVSAEDVQLIASFWLQVKPEYDFALNDGLVTIADIMEVATQFNQVCSGSY